MKMKLTITDINQEDLVNLLATATFTSNWLTVSVPKTTRDYFISEPDDCREDVWAKALLAGYPVCFEDNWSEGETYGQACVAQVEFGGELTSYMVNLKRIQAALESALDGSFEGDEDMKRWASKCAHHLISEPEQLDQPEAEALCQIIMFNEIIYG